MEICMTMEIENEKEAVYSFNDGFSQISGKFRIDKQDVDRSEIISLPEELKLTEADVQKGMTKVIRLGQRDNGKYPVYIVRVR